MIPNDFSKARLQLVVIYLIIIAGIIGLFSFLVIREADERQGSASATAEQSPVLTDEEVLARAHALVPGKSVIDTEYEITDGELYYSVEFEGETDVKGNLFTGEVLVEHDEARGIVETLTDDFGEMVIWIGLVVFLLAGLVSVYVASRTLRPIAENIRKQKQFVSGAAHELRNPLAALHARIESALRSSAHAGSRDVLADLLSETKRLIALSERLLSLERMEDRKPNLQMCAVRDSVANVSTRLKPFLEEKNISLRIDTDATSLRIDSEDLETILYNLIHNAIKFSDEGGEVRVVWKNGMLCVEDDGVGIAENALPHIFERFYTTGTMGAGTGLGLALVKEIVGRYDGTVNVTSEVGKGSTFSVTFPSVNRSD
jgi:signal transduction histidine kinase